LIGFKKPFYEVIKNAPKRQESVQTQGESNILRFMSA